MRIWQHPLKLAVLSVNEMQNLHPSWAVKHSCYHFEMNAFEDNLAAVYHLYTTRKLQTGVHCPNLFIVSLRLHCWDWQQTWKQLYIHYLVLVSFWI
jgi:hypothetical protein